MSYYSIIINEEYAPTDPRFIESLQRHASKALAIQFLQSKIHWENDSGKFIHYYNACCDRIVREAEIMNDLEQFHSTSHVNIDKDISYVYMIRPE